MKSLLLAKLTTENDNLKHEPVFRLRDYFVFRNYRIFGDGDRALSQVKAKD